MRDHPNAPHNTSGAVCVQYRENTHPTKRRKTGSSGVDTLEFGPGVLEMMRRATKDNPVFVCVVVTRGHTRPIIAHYLVTPRSRCQKAATPSLFTTRILADDHVHMRDVASFLDRAVPSQSFCAFLRISVPTDTRLRDNSIHASPGCAGGSRFLNVSDPRMSMRRAGADRLSRDTAVDEFNCNTMQLAVVYW
jgi:hypothetical protein